MADYRVRIVVEGEDRASGPLGKVAGSLGRIGEFAAGSLVADGIKAVGRAIGGLGKGLFDAAMDSADLNSQISGIVALAGGATGDIQALKDVISDLAIDPNLVVSSTEAAGIIQELVAGGLTLEDVFAGAAESTVLLANATGAEFSTAATVASDTMSIFGIKAEDMMTAVNGITSVVNQSKFDINDYALALSQGGGVAAFAGVEFDDFNTAITAMSSKFASGSDAGTSFKTMLLSLIPKSAEAASKMSELGLMSFDTNKAMQLLTQQGIKPASNGLFDIVVAMQDTFVKSTGLDLTTEKGAKAWGKYIKQLGLMKNQFFDANGNLKSMAEISGALNTALKDLTEEQRLGALETIFGTDAMRAAGAMAGMTEQEFRKLQETMGQTDALESARIRVDNLAGDMAIFSGVLEDVRLRVGDSFQPALREIYQSATQLLTGLSPLILAGADAVAGYIERVLPGATTAITNFVEGIPAAYAQVQQVYDQVEAGVGVVKTAVQGIGALGVAVGDFVATGDVAGVTAIFDSIRTSLESLQLPTMSDVWNAAKVNITTVISEVDWTVPAEQFSAIKDGVVTAISGIDWSTVGAEATTLFGGLTSAVQSQLAAIDWSMLAGVGKGAASLFGGLTDTVQSQLAAIDWSALGTEATTTFDGLKTSVQTQMAAIDWSTLGTEATTTFDGLKSSIQTQLAAVDWSSIGTEATTTFDGLKTAVQTQLSGIDWATLGDDTLSTLQTGATNLKGAVVGAITDFEWTIDPAQTAQLQTVLAEIEPMVTSIFGAGGIVPTITSTINESIVALGDRLATVDAQALGVQFTSIVGGVTALATSFSNMQVDAALTRVGSVMSLGTDVLNFLSGFGASIDTTVVTTAISGFASNFATQLASTLGDSETLNLGEAVGNFAGTIITKLGEALSAPGLGQEVGESAGQTVSVLAKAAANIVTGFATELAGVDWAEFSTNVNEFVQGFAEGAAGAVREVDWGPVAKAMVDALAAALAGIVGGIFPLGLFGKDNPLDPLKLGTVPEAPSWEKLPGELNTILKTTQPWMKTLADPPDPAWAPTLADPPDPAWAPTLANPPEPTWTNKLTDPPEPAWANKLTSIFDELDTRTGLVPDKGELGQEIQTAIDSPPTWLPTYTAPPPPTWMPSYTNPPAPSWVTSLTSVLSGYNVLGPGTLPGTAPGTKPAPPAAEKIDWSSYITALDWGSVVSSLDWAGFVSSLSWAGFVSSLSWGSYVKSISWGSFIPSISWGSFIPSINWASFIPAAAGGGGGTGQASGTNFWRGGLTWVGEKGAELVSLPRGSTIYNHERSVAMAGMGGGGITMQNTFVVNSELDIEAAAYRILDVIRRHR